MPGSGRALGITMFLQMQLNPQQPDPIQQQVFNWMPVMFTFMLGSFPVTGSSATVSFTMPATIKKAGVVTGTIQPAGTTFQIPAQRSTTTTTSVVRVTRLVHGVGGWMVVKVSGGFTPYGRVVVTTGSGQQLGAGFLQNGIATIRLRAWVLPVGTHTVTVSYEGNGVALPSSTTATVQVVRR